MTTHTTARRARWGVMLAGLALPMLLVVPGCAAAEPAGSAQPAAAAATTPIVPRPAPAATEGLVIPGFPEYPALSPDGRFLVFSFAGDLWGARTDAPVAARLTAHAANETRSAFSPCGTRLAFESDRDGARNLYVADLAEIDGKLVAAPARRVTITDQNQLLGGWNAEGTHLYYADRREPGIYRQSRLWRVPVDGGPTERVTDAFGSAPNPGDDGSVVFQRGYAIQPRPIYRGPGALNLWRLESDGRFTRLTNFNGNDFEGHPLPDGSTVFISSRDGQNNVHRLRPGATDDNPRNVEQLTRFAPAPGEHTIAHGVRDLTVSRNGRLAAFVVWDTIYTLDLTRQAARPEPRRIVITADTDTLDTNRLSLDRRVDEAAISPDGKTVAVAARGEVFVRATADDRPTRRVTRTHAREGELVWSPCGTTLFFTSDDPGVPTIYAATVALARPDLGERGLAPRRATPPAPPAAEENGAPEDDGITGRWSMLVAGPDNTLGLPPEVPFILEISRDGDTVAVTLEIPGLFTGEAEGVSFDPETGLLTFTVTAEGVGVATFEITLREGVATGFVDGEPGRFELSGQRDKPVVSSEPEADAPASSRPSREKPADPGERWAEALRFHVEPFIEDDQGASSATPSPDGRKQIYIRGRGDVVLVDLSDMSRRVLWEGWNTPEIHWAGDSRHIVFALSDFDFNRDIFIADTEGEGSLLDRAINLSRHPDLDTSPRLSADGKVLYFLSDRAGNNFEYDVYRVFLDRKLEGMRPYDLAKHFEDTVASMRRRKPIAPVDFGADYTPPEPFTFDTDDAYMRVQRLTSFPGSQSNIATTPAGELVMFRGNVDGTTGLYSVDYRGQNRRSVRAAAVSGLGVSLDGQRVSYVLSGQAGSARISGGQSTTYGIEAPIVIDVPEEQRRKFLEAARVFGEGFYHPTMKGVDWDAMTERYLELAVGTRTSDAFNRVLNLMFGEVDASHTGASGGDGYNAPSPANGELGVETEPAPGGFRVTRVVPGSPADQLASRIHIGEIILAVDDTRLAEGEDAMPHTDLHFALVGTRGRETLLEVRPIDAEDGDIRFVLIEPVSSGAMTTLRYEDEVAQRRAEVDRLSNGRLGYLHIRGMNMPSVRDFERDLFAAANGKDALIIDVRDNGGGSTTDILLASLTAPNHAYTVPRGADPDVVPRDAYPRDRRLIYGYSRPIVVLINEMSFSNAEIFAHSIKTIGRGKIVGTQTFGGVISTGSHQLLDGGRIRMPGRGWYLPDGTDMENNGTIPDVPVDITPADEVAGRDPQLEAAVRTLLRDLGN